MQEKHARHNITKHYVSNILVLSLEMELNGKVCDLYINFDYILMQNLFFAVDFVTGLIKSEIFLLFAYSMPQSQLMPNEKYKLRDLVKD